MANRAVILAGGKGSRLAPYTTVIPKPLLPVGDRSILEIVVHQLRDHGFTDMTLAVGYLSHLIKAIFGDGAAHGVGIEYHEEDRPLGTAGPLATIERLDEPFLMLNGDVLTTMDFRGLYEAHVASGNVLTIASHRRVVSTEYGVLELEATNGAVVRRVEGYVEKPEIPYVVSMGVYVVSPAALEFVGEGHFDVPDLVLRLIGAGQPVGAYEYQGYWLDIGRHDDYQTAIEDYERIAPLIEGTTAQSEATVATGRA